ncbi:UDP-N-acetylmuramoyl-L-alanyl-D-glutamate--2,6-diaminopimelate ligase [Polaromonas sp. C04]|uniref:UDP-N-acetylmuramoyl-L-alanyl-D-glutamate--2, 6-diaminopimelate ligase n=1 Tax=Polaromonas sp. C04 TaxID=1945857 RepID=UPI000986A058|nr:UDP-N-acetylmuramoyl-L-alanyl-D-glutamate--2,6-diaminopimelate ligase [Polaromonas sp. C04]OOG50674.1 UDP-N-acetylmuramoyl-L-alanyl-D-glutamate--2,6-diaminopimelate ligase [Polaromonas sp. C04]
MKTLCTPVEASRWLHARVRGTLQADSRSVGPGDGFVAWPGAATDGRRYVAAALAQGAGACLVEQAGVEAFGFEGDAIASYAGLKAATGPIAAAYFEAPTLKLDVLAVTGTNGKTSIAWWLAQALSNVKQPALIPCGLIGTLGIGRPPQVEFNGLTTPDPVLLQKHFRRFVDEGLRACAIEASSIGLAERRLDGTRIRVALFSNLTQDHLDYHGSMQAYWQAKAGLFRWPGLQAAVINVDDTHGAALAASLAGREIDVWTVSCAVDTPARLQAHCIGYATQGPLQGLCFSVVEGEERHELATPLIGQYNVSNLLCVIGGLRAMGVALQDAVQACQNLLPVPGRMDCVAGPEQPLVAIDYAHTPDALDKALLALRPLAQQRGGRLWCVFGCGGDRDAGKRPLMAAIAQRNADHVVVTSDNPRSENPDAIIGQILRGLSRQDAAHVQPDRALAIAETVAQAGAQDVVLIAGKGHEDYQEVAGVRHAFSDKTHARQALQRREVEA